jgi:hypothetical protein
MQMGWERTLRQIDDARQKAGVADMPVLFTELGYTSNTGSTIKPWLGGVSSPPLVAWGSVQT